VREKILVEADQLMKMAEEEETGGYYLVGVGQLMKTAEEEETRGLLSR
jgi:hydrogenase maturation factor